MEKDEKIKKRNSNIELLKIIAMLLITISHVIPYNYPNPGNEYINIGNASMNFTNIALQFIRYLGQIGNVIFVICSSYFLLEKKKTKYKKVMQIIIDNVFISVICLIFILLNKYNISKKEIIKQFFPLTFSNNWFIGTYIIFYIFAPLLNKAIDSMKKRELFITTTLFCILNIWQFIKANNYINSYLLGFITIYFIVAYLKKHKQREKESYKITYIKIGFLYGILIIFILLINFISLKLNIGKEKMQYFTNMKNPIPILIGLLSFEIVITKEKKINNFINSLSSVTLFIYLFHDNILIRQLIRKDYYKYIYNTIGYKYIVIICLLSSIVTFVIATFVSEIYKMTIQKISSRINEKIYEKICKKIDNKWEEEAKSEKVNN